MSQSHENTDDRTSSTEDLLKQQEFELARARLSQERELKEKELALQHEQLLKSRWSGPATAAILAAVIAIVGTLLTSIQNRKLERQKQEGTLILEAIKTGGEGKDKEKQTAANLVFLADVDLISIKQDALEKLRLRAGETLPSLPAPSGDERIRFKASTAATPELQNKLRASFDPYTKYVEKLGLRSKAGPVDIEINPDLKAVSLYDLSTNRIVLNQAYANDPDFLFRDYTIGVLSEQVPSNSDLDDNIWFLSIRSGLGFYFPCSFLDDPLFGKTAFQTIYSNLKNERKFSEVTPDADINLRTHEMGTIWGGVFWEVRKLLGKDQADKFLLKGWIALRASKGGEDIALNFVRNLLEQARTLEQGKYVNDLRSILVQRGLKL